MPEADIEAILADFRAWLNELPDATTEAPEAAAPKLDVAAVVGHFTALRQEVNLLTKSARAALEQNALALDELRKPAPPDPAVLTQPLVKALIEVADALAGASKSLEKSKATLAELPEALRFATSPPPPSGTSPAAPHPGFLARLLGRTPAGDDSAWRAWAEQVAEIEETNAATLEETRERFAPLLAGLGDGYSMSLRRIERLLPQYDLEAIPAVGEPFDPEFMEAVEVVDRPIGLASGVVVEELRRGYLRSGRVFRYALVKVAR